jgi:hypothetical protein
VYVDSGVTITPAGKIVVGPDQTLVVTGAVTLAAGTVIDAVEGTLTLAEGASIAGSNTSVILVEGQAPSGITNTITPTYYSALPSSTPGGPFALSSFTVNEPSGTTWDQLAGLIGSQKLYITGDLGVKGGSFSPTTALITVYGDVKAEGTIALSAAGWIPEGALVADGAAPLTLNGLATYGGKLDTGSNTVTAIDTPAPQISLAALNGSGKLVLPQDTAKVVITEGGGNVEFAVSGTPGPVPLTASGSSFGNTGTTTFPRGATLSDDVSFSGKVSVAGGETITMTNGKKITLNKNAALAVVGSTSSILVNNTTSSIELTSTIGAVALGFVAGGGGKITQGGGGAAATFTVGTGTLTLNGAYEVVSANGAVGMVSLTGSLSLGAEGSLVLAGAATNGGAKLIGTGDVIAGNTRITGGGADGWKAGDTAGKVVIGPNSIGAADATAVSLIAQGSDDAPKITVGAASTFTIGANTTIDLSADTNNTVGSIVLTAHTTTTNGGKLSFAPTDTSKITAHSTGSGGGPTSAIAVGAPLIVGLDLESDSGGTAYLRSITSKAVGDTHTIQAVTPGTNVTLGAATIVS